MAPVETASIKRLDPLSAPVVRATSVCAGAPGGRGARTNKHARHHRHLVVALANSSTADGLPSGSQREWRTALAVTQDGAVRADAPRGPTT